MGQTRYLLRHWAAAIAPGLAVLVVLAATARADDGHSTDALRRGADLLEGRADYVQFCADCHGASGQGGGGAASFRSPAAVVEWTRKGMIDAARRGHAPTVSAAWDKALDETRLAQIVDYVRDAFMLPVPTADASLGRKIYARSCSVCHGERGDAASWAQNSLNPPPRDFTSAKALAMSRQEMINTVTYGSPGTAMMPFVTQLSREEVAAVVDYIRRAVMKVQDHSAAVAAVQPSQPTPPQAASAGEHDHRAHGHDHASGDMDAPFPASLSGDYARGMRFYEKNCAECHGTRGDGKGRRAYFMTKKPEDFTTPKARAELNRPHLFEAVAKGVKGTEMPAWSKVLNGQQIADVAEYVFSAFIRPKPASQTRGHPVEPARHAPDGQEPKKKH